MYYVYIRVFPGLSSLIVGYNKLVPSSKACFFRQSNNYKRGQDFPIVRCSTKVGSGLADKGFEIPKKLANLKHSSPPDGRIMYAFDEVRLSEGFGSP
jgi:hypothetical protein